MADPNKVGRVFPKEGDRVEGLHGIVWYAGKVESFDAPSDDNPNVTSMNVRFDDDDVSKWKIVAHDTWRYEVEKPEKKGKAAKSTAAKKAPPKKRKSRAKPKGAKTPAKPRQKATVKPKSKPKPKKKPNPNAPPKKKPPRSFENSDRRLHPPTPTELAVERELKPYTGPVKKRKKKAKVAPPKPPPLVPPSLLTSPSIFDKASSDTDEMGSNPPTPQELAAQRLPSNTTVAGATADELVAEAPATKGQCD